MSASHADTAAGMKLKLNKFKIFPNFIDSSENAFFTESASKYQLVQLWHSKTLSLQKLGLNCNPSRDCYAAALFGTSPKSPRYTTVTFTKTATDALWPLRIEMTALKSLEAKLIHPSALAVPWTEGILYTRQDTCKKHWPFSAIKASWLSCKTYGVLILVPEWAEWAIQYHFAGMPHLRIASSISNLSG